VTEMWRKGGILEGFVGEVEKFAELFKYEYLPLKICEGVQ